LIQKNDTLLAGWIKWCSRPYVGCGLYFADPGVVCRKMWEI